MEKTRRESGHVVETNHLSSNEMILMKSTKQRWSSESARKFTLHHHHHHHNIDDQSNIFDRYKK